MSYYEQHSESNTTRDNNTTSTNIITNRSSIKHYYQQYTATTAADSNTSTTTTTNTPEPGVFWLEQIRQAYNENIGKLNMPVARYIENLLFSVKMEPGVIIYAIERTGWARTPSAAYMRSILERYKREGVLTVKQLEYDRYERRLTLQDANNDRWGRWYESDLGE